MPRPKKAAAPSKTPAKPAVQEEPSDEQATPEAESVVQLQQEAEVEGHADEDHPEDVEPGDSGGALPEAVEGEQELTDSDPVDVEPELAEGLHAETVLDEVADAAVQAVAEALPDDVAEILEALVAETNAVEAPFSPRGANAGQPATKGEDVAYVIGGADIRALTEAGHHCQDLAPGDVVPAVVTLVHSAKIVNVFVDCTAGIEGQTVPGRQIELTSRRVIDVPGQVGLEQCGCCF